MKKRKKLEELSNDAIPMNQQGEGHESLIQYKDENPNEQGLYNKQSNDHSEIQKPYAKTYSENKLNQTRDHQLPKLPNNNPEEKNPLRSLFGSFGYWIKPSSDDRTKRNENISGRGVVEKRWNENSEGYNDSSSDEEWDVID